MRDKIDLTCTKDVLIGESGFIGLYANDHLHKELVAINYRFFDLGQFYKKILFFTRYLS
jgi:hypothetical protein